MLRCSFLILSAARSRALRTVVPLPSPTVVPFLSSRTACAAALSLAFSTQLICSVYPSVSICSRRSMALRTSSLMVSIFSSALFLAFSRGLSFGGGGSSVVGSVGSALASACFGSVGLVFDGFGRVGDGRVFLMRALILRNVFLDLFKRSFFGVSRSF